MLHALRKCILHILYHKDIVLHNVLHALMLWLKNQNKDIKGFVTDLNNLDINSILHCICYALNIDKYAEYFDLESKRTSKCNQIVVEERRKLYKDKT